MYCATTSNTEEGWGSPEPWPNSIVVDLSSTVEQVLLCTPPGGRADLIRIAERACRIYSDVDEFYSLPDEISLIHPREGFLRDSLEAGALNLSGNGRTHAVIASYDLYLESLVVYASAIINTLNKHGAPTAIPHGCGYLPDAFIYATYQLVLRLSYDF